MLLKMSEVLISATLVSEAGFVADLLERISFI